MRNKPHAFLTKCRWEIRRTTSDRVVHYISFRYLFDRKASLMSGFLSTSNITYVYDIIGHYRKKNVNDKRKLVFRENALASEYP